MPLFRVFPLLSTTSPRCSLFYPYTQMGLPSFFSRSFSFQVFGHTTPPYPVDPGHTDDFPIRFFRKTPFSNMDPSRILRRIFVLFSHQAPFNSPPPSTRMISPWSIDSLEDSSTAPTPPVLATRVSFSRASIPFSQLRLSPSRSKNDGLTSFLPSSSVPHVPSRCRPCLLSGSSPPPLT